MITRIGDSPRWSDIVIHNGVAQWVEVASDLSASAADQIAQVLQQIDDTLKQLGSSKTNLLHIQIFLANLADRTELNRQWDAWVLPGHAPTRACVGVELGDHCLVEMIVSAAVEMTG